ncbi:hypothetical protein J2Z83_000328 [Virgibacillus natechei]|uniref:DUF5325 family protein n=1 Tax=Virgibacillus natechei TaxID=1216297 RepID=A0ABS4IBB9_9BACI|nr:DUF5325 family protein [Virgibacillus natechei]MBP1968236.1 hypothetical protein [Virgibacillus natechei]UZD14494.1 YlaF family protein [Virgibacillus natechei]
MKNINFPMLLLALLVISLFASVGVAIAFRSVLFIILFMLLGFLVMGYGITLKRKRK